MKKRIIRFSLAFGIVLFVVLVWKVGPARILAGIQKLSWMNFLILVGLRLGYWVLRTNNWRIIFECFNGKQSFRSLFEARIIANAISSLTPSVLMGGEPIRALMMDGSSRRKNFATVTLDKTIEIITMAFFTVLAVLIAVFKIPMSGATKVLFAFFIGLTLALCLFLLIKQRQSGLFIWIIDVLGKLRIRPKFIERNRANIKDIDSYVLDFYKNHRKRIPLIVFLYSLTFFFWAAEIHITLLFLNTPNVTFFKSFLIITLGNIALLLPMIPGSLGVYEVTNIGVFALLGWGAGIALSMAIIRRIIMLIWTGIGLLVMLKKHVKS